MIHGPNRAQRVAAKARRKCPYLLALPLLIAALGPPACKRGGEDGSGATADAVESDVRQAPPAPPPAAIRPGLGIGPLVLGQAPPAGHDGARSAADRRLLYWSEQGIEAGLDAGGKVVEAVAHGAGGDSYFREPFPGRTAEDLGPGSDRAAVVAAYGPAQEQPVASAFVPGLVRLAYPARGLAFDVAGASGEVVAVRVSAPAR